MKKRALSLLMALVMVVSLLPATVRAADSTLSGDISVGTAADLAALGGQDIEGNITLTANIDMSNTKMTPIKSLKGCFNGDGKTISGLALEGGNDSNTGLIGQLDGSVINLKMTDVSITGIGSYNNVGTLVGYIADGSTSKIDNCYVSGTITSTTSSSASIGGLVGYMTGAIDTHTALSINNCVSNVTLTCARSNYIGGLLGTAQYYSDVTITKCAQLGNFSGSATAGGVIGYINSASTALTLSDSYLGGKVDGNKKYGVAYNLRALSSLSCTNFYYDNEKNKPEYSWDSFYMLKNGENSISSGVKGKSTDELKKLELNGFEVRKGEFDGYPVPVYTKAEPLPLPKITVSAKVEFTNTEGGTVTVTDPFGETVEPNEDKTYILTEVGEYTYTVTGMEQYKDVEGSFKIGKGDDGQTKTITVPHEYKDVDLNGTGTQEAPILISTASELRTLASKVNDGE